MPIYVLEIDSAHVIAGMATGSNRRAAATEQDMSELPFAATTPISVRAVGLKARDAEGARRLLPRVVGLEELSADGETITLGAKGRPLLVIEGR